MIVKLNNVTQNAKPGLSITEVLTEPLNKGVVVFPHTAPLDIEPLDDIEIDDSGRKMNMVVAPYRATVSDWQNNKWNYEVNLISPLLKLQRVVLPNRVITQSLITGFKSILYYFAYYLVTYELAEEWTLSQSLQDLLATSDAPELSWQQPTLYEVFQDLLATVDAVMRIEGVDINGKYIIGYYNVYETGDEIDQSNLSNQEITHDVDDYVTELEMDLRNVINKRNRTHSVDWVSPRTTQDYLMNDDNMEIVLDKPIFTIDKLVYVQRPPGGGNLYIYDITSQCIEKQLYDTKFPSNSLNPVQGDFRRNFIYWVEGQNTIQGLGFRESSWSPLNTERAIGNAVLEAVRKQSLPAHGAFDTPFHRNIAFYVEWTSMDGLRFRTEKTVDGRNSSTLIDTQQTAFIDIDRVQSSAQAKVNRLGNRQMKIWGRYDSYNDIPKLQDTIDDYVLINQTITYNDGYYQFYGELSEHFAVIDMFTGLWSERRYTQFADEKDAFLCNHIENNRYKFSFTNANHGATILKECAYMARIGKANDKLQFAVAMFYTDTLLENFQGRFGKALNVYKLGKSLAVNFSMFDNISAGLKVSLQGNNSDIHYMEHMQYVDSNGEFVAIKYWLVNEYDNTDIESDNGLLFDPAFAKTKDYPKINLTEPQTDAISVFKTEALYRFKDNREITSETMQFFVTGDNNIFVKDYFFSLHAMVYQEATNKTLKFAFSTTLTYKENDTMAKGTIAGNITVNISSNVITFVSSPQSIADDIIASASSYAICDTAGKLIIAVNNVAKLGTLYLNKEGV